MELTMKVPAYPKIAKVRVFPLVLLSRTVWVRRVSLFESIPIDSSCHKLLIKCNLIYLFTFALYQLTNHAKNRKFAKPALINPLWAN